MKRVCIVGAGTAGLCAARRALESKFSVTIYEQTRQIGGTWVYTDKTGTDEYGIDIHSSMYQGLRTNLPKEVMGYPDFPIKGGEESYVPSHVIEQFLMDYYETVLIIGAGPSGMDLCHEISKVAKLVTLSHHMTETPKTEFRSNVNQRPDVAYIDGGNVYFQDSTSEKYSIIFYCTGYKYAFPFLSMDCGIYVDDNYVQPLYKHCVNIKYPNMAFVGIPFYVCAAQMFDLQSRFILKFWTGQKSLPTQEEMLEETRSKMEQRYANGFKKRQAHMMGEDQIFYYNDLAETADIENIKPVMTALHNESSKRFVDDLLHFRDDVFRIKDDEEFIKIK